jgi:hypothetical protein
LINLEKGLHSEPFDNEHFVGNREISNMG